MTFVFAGDVAKFNGWSKAKTRLDQKILDARRDAAINGGATEKELKAIEGIAPWRLHDIRRTLATGLQRLGVRLEVTEAVLNHVSGSRAGIVGVYQRHDWAAENKAALEAWAAHLEAVVAGRAVTSNVAEFPRQTA